MDTESPGPLAKAESAASSSTGLIWPDIPNEIPEQIGEYEVDRVIARGAHGIVFKGTDSHGLRVAIKWLNNRKDESELDTFVQLSKTVKGMPPILSSGVLEDRTYFVMPYYERRSLRFRLRRSKFPQSVPEVIRMANAFTEVLGELHRHGYTHFDFKPDNLLLEALPAASEDSEFSLLRLDERVVLTDFGTTRSEQSEDSFGDGTLGYAAPELLTNVIDHDPRVDVYAASATLVECMTGIVPAQVRSVADSAFEPDVLRRTGPLEPVLRKGLSFDPLGRPETISKWLDALHEKADVVQSFSATSGHSESESMTRSFVPAQTINFSDEERSKRGLGEQAPRKRSGDKTSQKPQSPSTSRKLAKDAGFLMATVSVVLFAYWGLTKLADRPSLVESPASGSGAQNDQPDESASGGPQDGGAQEGDVVSDAATQPVVTSPVVVGPPLLESIADSSWGTIRRRLTAVQYDGDGPGQSDGARYHRVQYTSRPIMSPDERWILADRDSNWTVVDRTSGEFREVGVSRYGQPTWHRSDPATILHLAEDSLALLSSTIDGPTTVAADLTEEITAELPGAYYLRAPFHGEPSVNGSRWAWAVFDGNHDPIGFVTYDMSTGGVMAIKKEMPSGDIGDFVSITITKSGDSVVLAFEDALVIYEKDFTNEWRIEQRPFAYELAMSGSWQDMLVVANFNSGTFGAGWIVAYNLDDRSSTRLLNLYDDAGTNIHFSGLATEKAGWVLASTYDCKSDGAWSCDRIMAINIDDGTIVNIAETNSCADNSFTVPHAVVNQDFTLAWFNTDFGSCGDDATIVELEIDPFDE